MTVASPDSGAAARALIEANAYMTLATADENGDPWPSPVWFAHQEYAEFIWVSRTEAKHSRDIAGRPRVGIVIFDSNAPLGTGVAVYLQADAEEIPPGDREAALEVFSRRSLEQGGRRWSADDVSGEASHRLYRARATAAYLLDDHDERTPVELA